MSQLQDLHLLIHSLTKGEKRFFRLSQSQLIREGSQTSRLLEVMQNELPGEDAVVERALIELGLEKNLPTLIGRLRKAVLDSLRTQHGGRTVESRLQQTLEIISILFKKKLYGQAMWSLRKAKRLAERYAHRRHLGLLIQWERKIVTAQFPRDSTMRMLELRKEELQNTKRLTIHEELEHLSFLARNLIKERLRLEEGAEKAELESVSCHPLVSSELHSGDFLAFNLASNIRGTYLNGLGQYEEAAEVYGKAFETWKESPDWIREKPDLFISIYTNYQVSLYHSQDDLDLIESCQLFIRSVNLKSPGIQLTLQNLSYQGGLLVYLNTGRYEEGVRLADEIGKWLEKNRGALSADVQLTFLYNTCVIYFITAQFQDSLRLVYRILDLPGKSARKDIREFARLFQLVLLYELQERESLEYYIQAAYQYFVRQQITTIQQYTISLLKNLMKVIDPEKEKEVFTAYLEKLDALSESPGGLVLGYGELRIWAIARSRGIVTREAFDLLRSMMPEG